jgi:hypothetical protein
MIAVRLRWTRLIKLVFAAAVISLACGPAVFARNDNDSQSYWLQQRQLDEQKQQTAAPAQRRPSFARRPARDFVPVETTRAPGSPGGAPIQPLYFIDVVGDSLASLLADGLQEAFTDKPEVSIVSKAHESSGLVRDDFYDWPKAATGIASGPDRIDNVVIMIGINDLQAIKDGADSYDPLTDKWRDAYVRRIEGLVAPFRAAHVAVTWVGLPPMRSDRYNADVIKLNEIYKDYAEKAGFKYVDIWDAFASENGQYDAYGPDINGQNAKLRGADGVHFTKAGARKAAQFLEADITHALEGARPQSEIASLPPDIEQATNDINAQIRREMGVAVGPIDTPAPAASSKPPAGAIMPLTDLPRSQGGVLAKRSDSTTAQGLQPSFDRVLTAGIPVEPRAGRADDFHWPRL